MSTLPRADKQKAKGRGGKGKGRHGKGRNMEEGVLEEVTEVRESLLQVVKLEERGRIHGR